MPLVAEWRLVSPEKALQLIANEPIGSRTIDSKPIEIALEANTSFGGNDRGNLSINGRGAFTVAILNDPDDPDEDGILGSQAGKTAEGVLPPHLQLDPALAYLKLRIEAGLKATAGTSLGSLVGIDAEAQASAVFADYRVHRADEEARRAFLTDVETARFATKLEDVLALQPREALAFRFGGLAYSPDVSDLDDEAEYRLQELDVWILDALRYMRHPSHLSVEEALAWIKRIKPKRAVLTHMHVDLDYAALARELPEGVEPGYDGMVLTTKDNIAVS